jgi:hypothetical protein
MGRREDRRPRLREALTTPEGYVRLAVCSSCGRAAALPVGLLVARYGPLWPLEDALGVLRCVGCGERGADTRMVRLCDRGCPRQR